MLSFLKKKDPGVFQYDSKIIKNFHKDHEKLIKSIAKISQYIEKDDKKKVKNLLKQFKTTILHHFMEEDIKLYRYLKKYYCDSHETLAIIKNFETGIKVIQKDIINFLDYYTQDNTILNHEFKEQFHTVINNLEERIRTEEKSLYPLYTK
jgi:hypothetical protein